MNPAAFDPWLPVIELKGHWITVQRMAARLRAERSGIRIREQYSKFAPKRIVFMQITGQPPAIVKIDRPSYPDKGGAGAKRTRKRRQ
jgi:hypothetical protein